MHFLENYWSAFLNRFVSPYYPESILYFALFFVLTFAYFRYRHGEKWLAEIKKTLSLPHQNSDLSFDVRYYLFMGFFDCLFVYWISVSLFSVHIWVQTHITSLFPKMNILGSWPIEGWFLKGILAFYFFLIWDFATYLGHYLHHRIPWLWEFHKFHHNSYSLNPFTAYRIHFANDFVHNIIVGLCMAFFSLPVFLVFENPPQSLIYQVGFFHIFFQFLMKHFHHSPFFISFPNWLSRFFLSPAMHQIHHSLKPEHVDKNFAIIFSLWDKCFGTQYIPHRDEEIVLGMGAVKKSIVQELIRPFQSIYVSLVANEKDRGEEKSS